MLEKIALQKKLITRSQCEEAQAACRNADNLEIALKEYFLSKDILSLNQVKVLVITYHALKIMKKNDLFGRIAVKLGHVGADLFNGEMARQKEFIKKQMPPRFIGEVWIDNKVLSQNEFKNILRASKQQQKSIPQGPSGASPPRTDTEIVISQPLSSHEPEVPDNTIDFSMKTELIGGMLLEVDREGMTAFVKKTENFDNFITPLEIKKQLMDQGIVYGITDEEKLHGFIRSSGFKEKPFKIASGVTPKPGNDARIEYYFDTDYLKAGEVDEEGNVDFKDRGEVPWVAKGTLLAEKFPMTESRNGTNVFNQIQPVPLSVDLPLKFKSGVIPSKDRLKLYAEISGHPILGMSGNIEVTSTFTVKADINYETGHLEYPGNIDIKGALKAGFQIKGQSVRIDTVDGGKIYAEGDVFVVNGVNDAQIYARGNVSAKFIQNSKIFCMGNLAVNKEIVNCTIETSGAVFIPTGEVLSSQIICNKGLYAGHLGTDKSMPNTVTAGVDAFIKKEIDAIESRILDCKDRLKNIRTRTKTLAQEIKDLYLATEHLPWEGDKAREEEMALIEEAETLKIEPQEGQAAGNAPLAALNSQIRNTKALVARLDKDLNTLFSRIERKENQMFDLAVEREELENILEDLFYEQANFNEWEETNPGDPVVSVTGRVTPGTVIRGSQAERLLTENMTNIIFKEVVNRDRGKAEIQIYENIKSK